MQINPVNLTANTWCMGLSFAKQFPDKVERTSHTRTPPPSIGTRLPTTLTFPSVDLVVDSASISLFATPDTRPVASSSDPSLSVPIANESFFSLLKRLRNDGLAATSVIPLAEGKPTPDRRLPKNWLDCRGNAVATELGLAGGNG